MRPAGRRLLALAPHGAPGAESVVGVASAGGTRGERHRMCGIVGYVGQRQALPILLAGLRRLEYRGYDSAGTAVVEDGRINVVRKAGRLEALEQELGSDHALPGVTGIGHTRWATHGAPVDANAHPHVDCSGEVAVIHNGIIENFLALRLRLEAEGHVLTSQTDTEC